MSNRFWHLVLHAFFSCWCLTKAYKTPEIKLKNCFSFAVFFLYSFRGTLSLTQGHPLTAFPCGPFLACRGRLCKWCSHAAFLHFYFSTWALLLSAVIHPVYGHFYYQYISPSVHHFSQLLSLSFWVVFHHAALFTFHIPWKRESELVRMSVRAQRVYKHEKRDSYSIKDCLYIFLL